MATPNGNADEDLGAVDYAVHGIRKGLPGFEEDHLLILQRAMLIDIADDMTIARKVLMDLAERHDMTEGAFAEDALSTIRRLRKELDVMDSLGWPVPEAGFTPESGLTPQDSVA